MFTEHVCLTLVQSTSLNSLIRINFRRQFQPEPRQYDSQLYRLLRLSTVAAAADSVIMLTDSTVFLINSTFDFRSVRFENVFFLNSSVTKRVGSVSVLLYRINAKTNIVLIFEFFIICTF